MEQIISKDEINNFLKMKGEAKKIVFKENMDFIIKEEGKEGLKRFEETMRMLGQPMSYRDMKSMDFCPIGLLALGLEVMKRLFGYDDDKFVEAGRFEPKTSFLLKFAMKYFFSLERLAEELPRAWSMYFTFGELEAKELNKEEKYIILEVKDFDIHNIFCRLFEGYFPAVVEMIIQKKCRCKETKCTFRGDDHHEFLLEW